MLRLYKSFLNPMQTDILNKWMTSSSNQALTGYNQACITNGVETSSAGAAASTSCSKQIVPAVSSSDVASSHMFDGSKADTLKGALDPAKRTELFFLF